MPDPGPRAGIPADLPCLAAQDHPDLLPACVFGSGCNHVFLCAGHLPWKAQESQPYSTLETIFSLLKPQPFLAPGACLLAQPSSTGTLLQSTSSHLQSWL